MRSATFMALQLQQLARKRAPRKQKSSGEMPHVSFAWLAKGARK